MDVLPPEIEEGNVEYKRRIDILPEMKCIKLRSQMEWRMSEGFKSGGLYEAHYYIGIEDSGKISGLDEEIILKSIFKLRRIAEEIPAKIAKYEVVDDEYGVYAHVLIVKMNKNVIEEINIAIIGDTGSGKTSLIGVLTQGVLDDGKGSASNFVYKHDHEYKNQSTSSITHQVIGYKDGQLINYSSSLIGSWSTVANTSDKVVNLIDLPGNKKYIKTIMYALLAYNIDTVLILSNPTVDLEWTEFLLSTVSKLELKKIHVSTKSDLYNYDENQFAISSVTGEGLDLFHSRMRDISAVERVNTPDEKIFVINDVINKSDVGVIIGGYMKSGRICINEDLYIGPSDNKNSRNSFYKIKIVSIHIKQNPSNRLNFNQIGYCIVKFCEKPIKIDKHMVIINGLAKKYFTNKFYIRMNKERITSKCVSILIDNVFEKVNINKIVVEETNQSLLVSFLKGRIRLVKSGQKIIIKDNSSYYIGRSVT